MAEAFRECLGEEYRLTVATAPDEDDAKPAWNPLDSVPPSQEIPTIAPPSC
jgi:hypothetical protein